MLPSTRFSFCWLGYTFHFLSKLRAFPVLSVFSYFTFSPAEPSVDLDLEYIENVFTYLES